ncbi:hypothetical protein COB52_05600 [Candidatus Kaiserbacteria bacterium]|nr:MAG: hypothetical protein COB52_05600 [Candidatus Kaiserbacteria bacterium]
MFKLDIIDGLDIVAMRSGEGEKIPFAKPPKVKGQVENWLDGVQ